MRPSTKKIFSGEHRLEFGYLPISTQWSGTEIVPFEIALTEFLPSTPKYVALGTSRIVGKKMISVEIVEFSTTGIKYLVTAPDQSALWSCSLWYLASNYGIISAIILIS